MSTKKEHERSNGRYEQALREQIARRNRAEFPEAAAFIDEMRRVFGEDVQVTYFGPTRPRRDPSLGEPEWSDDYT